MQRKFTGLTILVCSDEAATRLAMSEMLEQMGHVVWQCKSGTEALAILQGRELDMAVLDLQTPEMSGTAVAEMYHYAVPDNRIPLILVSTHIHAAVNDETRDYFDARLDKPIDGEKLAAAIANIAERKKNNPGRIRTELDKALQTTLFDPAGFSHYPKAALEEQFLSSLFAVFLENANTNLAKLKHSVEHQDIAAFGDLIHAMKGIAGNVKAKRLEAITSVCQEIDLESFQHHENTDYILDALQACLNATGRAMSDFLELEYGKHH
jgi:two-component system chemotaxis response regulator CheY